MLTSTARRPRSRRELRAAQTPPGTAISVAIMRDVSDRKSVQPILPRMSPSTGRL